MTTKKLATIILEKRARLSNVLHIGQIRADLGSSYEEALRRRWIVPNFESGELSVSNSAAILEEIRITADGNYQVGDTVVVVDNGQPISGVIQKVEGDKYVVSFKDGTQPKTPKSYTKDELASGDGDPSKPATPGSNQNSSTVGNTLNSTPLGH